MDQAKNNRFERGLSFLQPPRLTRDEFKSMITQKGWRMADVACRWSIRPEHLSRVAADVERDAKWDDLARALPLLSPNDQTAVSIARRVLIPPTRHKRSSKTQSEIHEAPCEETQRPVVTEPFNWDREPDDDEEDFSASVDGFRYRNYLVRGSELVVIRAIEHFAAEQAVLVVMEIREGADSAGGVQEEYRCESPNGTSRWFEPDEIDDWLVSNGKTRHLYE
ncbi:hypothetical protein [Pseudomonas abietaniphila]|uniref:hypothetical protein n=1 Tax=Pseudomonas abietaniphila TaxID=89065 RepID=UPI001ABFABEA|nr:hypothetical protein [Pseudomonas abietaniphila]